MSTSLSFQNYPSINLQETTQLDADALASATTLNVKNSQGFTANAKLVLGSIVNENLEIATVSSITDSTNIATSALKFLHKRSSQVTQLFGYQIKVYRAPNVDGSIPSDASFTVLDTIDIDIDDVETLYLDDSMTAGTESNYWYKYTYYNPDTPQETALAISVALRGGNAGNYCSIADIREEAGFNNNPNVTDQLIDKKRRAAQQFINGYLQGIYVVPFVAPINETIQQIATVLAAGMLLKTEFGVNSVLATEGADKVKSAEALLESLKNKTSVVVDSNGSSTAISGSNAFSSWPDRSTATADPSVGGGERKLRTSDRY